MGYTSVNEITLTRDFKTREIVVRWRDDITGEHERRFPFDEKKEALEFAAKEFNALSM